MFQGHLLQERLLTPKHVGVINVGVETVIDKSLVQSSGFRDASLLGWQLFYILPVAVLTNDFHFRILMCTSASNTERNLVIGSSIAAVAMTIFLTFVGATGLFAAWAGRWPLVGAWCIYPSHTHHMGLYQDQGRRFGAFDRPRQLGQPDSVGRRNSVDAKHEPVRNVKVSPVKGKFF